MKIIKSIVTLFSITLLILILLSQTNIGNLSHSPNSKEEKILTIGENEVRYSQMGQGKDILLIHGTPGSIEDWSSISKALASDYRVTAFDRLGHGFSGATNYEYHLNDNAELVKQIVNKLDLESPMIVGHSYGGSTVAHLISNHYNDDLNYMIIDSPLYDYEPSAVLKLLSIPILGKAIGLFSNYTIAEGQMEDGIRASLTNQNDADLENLIKERTGIWLQPKVLNSKALESVNYQTDLDHISDLYADITADVLVITGSNADITFRTQAERFSKAVKTDSLIIISNTGHYIQFDQSEKIIELIQEKLN